VGSIVFAVCRDLRGRDVHPVDAPERVVFRRTATGGFDEDHDTPAGSAR
jgi:hypothetical protein